jgi:hypothetical protein
MGFMRIRFQLLIRQNPTTAKPTRLFFTLDSDFF